MNDLAAPGFLLIDDHALFRAGLQALIGQAWPDAWVSQAADWVTAQVRLAEARVTQTLPSLIVLDQLLPDARGLAVLPALRALGVGCPVVMVSSEADLALRQAALAEGAAGLVPKAAPPAQLLAALQAALAGKPVDAVGLHYVVGQANRGVGVREPDGLLPRQREILLLLGRGTPNKAIARRLGMSEMGVRAEVSWLTEQLGARSREEALALAQARGWLGGGAS